MAADNILDKESGHATAPPTRKLGCYMLAALGLIRTDSSAAEDRLPGADNVS